MNDTNESNIRIKETMIKKPQKRSILVIYKRTTLKQQPLKKSFGRKTNAYRNGGIHYLVFVSLIVFCFSQSWT